MSRVTSVGKTGRDWVDNNITPGRCQLIQVLYLAGVNSYIHCAVQVSTPTGIVPGMVISKLGNGKLGNDKLGNGISKGKLENRKFWNGKF